MGGIRRMRLRVVSLVGMCALIPLVAGQGCPLFGTGAGATVTIHAPTLDQTLTLGAVVTIVYDATGSNIRAFYDRDGQPETGDEVIFATGLPSGANLAVQLQTASLAPGQIHIGIMADAAGVTTTAYAAGVITLEEELTIEWVSPAQSLSVGEGTTVPIEFDTGLTGFSYRLFYDQDGVVNGDEETIAEADDNALSRVLVDFDTTGLSIGTYYVGVTVTSSAGMTVSSYAPGTVTLVTGVFIQVLAPSVGFQAAVGDVIQIVVAANDPAMPDATVRVFYDLDTTPTNGNEVTIDTFAASEGGTTWNTQEVSPGEYYIGAELENGMTPPPVAYSAGAVRLLSGTDAEAVSFQILAPSDDVRILAGTVYTIRWYASGVDSGGTVTLYRDTDFDNDQQPDGNLTEIVAGLSPANRSYGWDTTGLTGRFFIVGRLTASDGTVVEAASRGRLEIRPPLFWVGHVGTEDVSGAVLRGFNFQDHAGSAFTPVGDVDGDGIDDFIVISQYGKPELVNPSGVGYGEAYLIYGNRTRLEGLFDLNRTGSRPASGTGTVSATGVEGIEQGVIFSGIVFQEGTGTNASGITSATSAPDMDGDSLDELVFGIPKVDSLSLSWQTARPRIGFTGLLENDGQFLRGGVVVVSSTNSLLTDRSAVSVDGTRVIHLQEVGQVFPLDYISPDCNEDIQCGNTPNLGQAYKDTDDDNKCDDFDYVAWDGTFYGTNPAIASPIYLCPIFDFLPLQTGLYRTAPLAPFGCRILGQAPDDGVTFGSFPTDGTTPDGRFGTVVSAIRSSGSPEFILISAPGETAKAEQITELAADRVNAGVVYQLRTTNYWDPTDTTPVSVAHPHQYVIRRGGYTTDRPCPIGTACDLIHRPFAIVGPSENAQIANVTAIPDFNQDGLMDVLVGSPNEGAASAGAVYIVFRRPFDIEGDYLLERLALPPEDPERLNGVMIRGEAGDRMGEAIAGGGDFNGDGMQDVVIGLPNHRGGRGAVLIVFGRHDLISPEGGFTIDEMVANGYAVLLVGENVGDLAGFNVASAGDTDGDGRDDLLIAAPSASPRFDSDGDGVKDTIGLDYDGDGVADDLTNSGSPTNLTAAGLVYLVRGGNTLIGEISLKFIGTEDLQGFAFVGRSANDNLGGGQDTVGLGTRSHGLATAGDVDGDGRSDILIGSMLADPEGKTNAGECYLIYGGLSP